MGMEAGPGPICAKCYDDVWRLSSKGWCDQCVLADLMRRLILTNPLTVRTSNAPGATVGFGSASLVVGDDELDVMRHVVFSIPTPKP